MWSDQQIPRPSRVGPWCRRPVCERVFVKEEQAMESIGRHRLTGLRTEYPGGGGDRRLRRCDRRGLFRPSRDHHGTPEHVAQFSPGWTRHLHVFDGREDSS
ncbi:DUF7710 domain-containing protein [Nocardioides eburneiflavus]|uniref:DUF7710 domain-containing protein n=1 Tax=Nocardioides eburneiflavus TaxID=2518372 RepID=UPI003CCC8508